MCCDSVNGGDNGLVAAGWRDVTKVRMTASFHSVDLGECNLIGLDDERHPHGSLLPADRPVIWLLLLTLVPSQHSAVPKSHMFFR